MAGYKLKRKGVDEVSDDFSDFSLSSPATKIRRLDSELPPIVEVEEEEPIPLPIPESESELESPNLERALVLFKPFLHSPSSPLSLTLHSDVMSGIKNQLPWSKQRDSDTDRLITSAEEQEEEDNNSNHRLALVPWVPSVPARDSSNNNNNNSELMEADEMGTEGEASMMMDIEQEEDTSSNYSTTLNQNGIGFGGITVPEGFHQWQQQQHCLLPRLPQNTSTPITWTR